MTRGAACDSAQERTALEGIAQDDTPGREPLVDAKAALLGRADGETRRTRPSHGGGRAPPETGRGRPGRGGPPHSAGGPRAPFAHRGLPALAAPPFLPLPRPPPP